MTPQEFSDQVAYYKKIRTDANINLDKLYSDYIKQFKFQKYDYIRVTQESKTYEGYVGAFDLEIYATGGMLILLYSSLTAHPDNPRFILHDVLPDEIEVVESYADRENKLKVEREKLMKNLKRK